MKAFYKTSKDVDNAYRKGMLDGIKKAGVFFTHLTTLYLADKLGFRFKRIKRFIDFIMKYSDMYISGDITDEEVSEILKEDYKIEFEFLK